MIHVWSDTSGVEGNSCRVDADAHAAATAGDTCEHVTSLDTLAAYFDRLRSGGVPVSAMDFHTHGDAGCVWIGEDAWAADTLGPFRNRGHEEIFPAGARIILTGCNIADGPVGELFLAEFGAVFLRGSGGTVVAYTGFGMGDDWLTDGDVWHPFGHEVRAEIRAGGAARLHGHAHLHPQRIRDRIAELQAAMDSVRCGRLTAAQSEEYRQTSNLLREASELLGPAAAAPSYSDVFSAHGLVRDAAARAEPLVFELRAGGMRSPFCPTAGDRGF